MKYARPRGTQDIIPPDIDTWHGVEDVFRSLLEAHCYSAIRTPLFESTDLFVRAVGEETDIISKEMYTFTDRGGRSLTLRPENTASVIRAYLENGMHRRGGIQRLYYFGPMFRYDRPQAGRYRQFHQIGAEAIGGIHPALDVEMMQIVVEAFRRLGFRNVELRLNTVGTPESRGPYREVLLEAIEAMGDELADAALRRYRNNPLRIFDSKDYGEEMKRRLPVITEHLPAAEMDHFAEVKALLEKSGISYTEDPHLVRGLDYYTKTVFEVYHDEHGAQSALCGGGRYDDLVEQCGGPPTPAIGFSVGVERVIASLPADSPAQRGDSGPDFYVVCADRASAARALALATELRGIGTAELDLSERSEKKQLKAAAKKNARAVVVVSDEDRRSVLWKDMRERTGERVPDDAVGGRARALANREGSDG